MNRTTFTENLEANQVIGVRSFDAPIEKVWNAWSNKDLLCQWWAPAPYVCEIQKMEFKEGGFWMYTMTGPEGDVHRGRMDFLRIEEHKLLETEEYFCDENGEKSGDIPPMKHEIKFDYDGAKTTITSTVTYASPEALKQMAEMGAAEGWELACNQLESVLTK